MFYDGYMAQLTLTLFGDVELRRDDESIDVNARKTLALLAYLAVSARPQSREHLAALLWPDNDERRARANLRGALWTLNQTPAAAWIEASPDTVELRPVDLEVDACRFEMLAAQEDDVVAQEEAVNLYSADFLSAFSLPDSSEFEAWAAARRQHYRRQALSALHRLTQAYLEQGDLGQAERLARRQIAIDNLREGAYRQLFLALARKGERAMALKEYQALRTVLNQELDVEPAPATAAAVEQIREGEVIAERAATAPSQTTAAAGAAAEAPSAQTPPSPYRGLVAFREEDAPYFFGREEFTDQLQAAVRNQSLVAVIGPSGSGKTSVVYAGLVAALRKQENWLVASFRLGARPFRSLAATLVELLDPDLSETGRLLEARKLATALADGEITLPEVVERVVGKKGAAPGAAPRLLLVADQFEELYTLVSDRATRRRFIDTVLDVIFEQQFRRNPLCTVVTTLRADFLGRALSYRPLADALAGADAKLGPMTRAELERAIVEPARLAGASFAPGLVARILDDVGHEPGNLPLLAFALDALWALQEDAQLTHGGYESVAKVEGALVRHADGVFEQLEADEQTLARRIFMQLVQPGEGATETRRLATREELGEAAWALVQRLADSRLLVTSRDALGQETVEVAHEALIDGWDRLRAWLEEDRAFRLWQEQLRAARRGWLTHDQDDGALLHGAALVTANEWLQRRAHDLSSAEEDYIVRSNDLQRRRQAQEARAHAERERLRRTRSLVLAAGLAVALLLALLAGAQWWRAEQQRRALSQAQADIVEERDLALQALSRQLAAEARDQVDEDYSLALLLALERVRRYGNQEAHESLAAVLSYNPRLLMQLPVSGDNLYSVAVAPGGQLLATAGERSQIYLWRLQHFPFALEQLATLLAASDRRVRQLTFSPDGNMLAVVQIDAVSLYHLADPSRPRQETIIDAQDSEIVSGIDAAAFSPDGERLVVGAGGDVHLYHTASGRRITSLADESQPGAAELEVSEVSFTPDGRLVVAGRNGALLVWDLSDGEVHRATTGMRLFGLAVSTDGAFVAVAGQPSLLEIWRLDRLQRVAVADDVAANILFDVVFLAADRLVSAGNDGHLVHWQVQGKQMIPEQLAAHEDTVRAVGAGAHMVAAADLSGTVTLWNGAVQPANGLRLQGHSGAVHELAFAAGQRLSSLSCEQWTAFIFRPELPLPCTSIQAGSWSISGQAGTEQFYGLEQSTPRVSDLALSPDGAVAYASFGDGSVKQWQMPNGGHSDLLAPQQGAIQVELALSRDGNLLAAGGCSGDDSALRSSDFSFCSAAEVYLWQRNPLQSEPRRVLEMDDLPARMALSADHRWLATFNQRFGNPQQDALLLWDLNETQSEPQQLGNEMGVVTALAFHPQSNQLATGELDGTVTLWDLPEAQDGRVVLQSGGPILALAYDPDGRYLAIGGCATAVESSVLAAANVPYCTQPELSLLDLQTGRQVTGPFLGHSRAILSLAFNNDGSLLASGDFSGDIILWDLPRKPEDLACRLAGRNLTQEEWSRFFGAEPYRPTCPSPPQLSDEPRTSTPASISNLPLTY